MRRSLATTTALVASLSLVLPFPVIAQDDDAATVECPADTVAEVCAALQAEGAIDGDVVQEPVIDEVVETPVEEVAPAAEVNAEVETPAEVAPEVETPAEVAPVEDVPAIGAADADEAADAPAEGGIEEAAPVEADVEAEVETETEAEIVVEEGADDAAAEVVDDADAAAPIEVEAAAEAEPEVEAETEADATPAADGGTAPAEVVEAPEANPETPEAASVAATQAASGEAAETMAGSDEDAGTPVEEVTEVVTEETSRRSDEEFETTAEAQATGNVSASSGGLTNLEAALLGAAGGFVVGALLNGDREIVSSAPDRVVVRDPSGNLQVLRDDGATLRQPGSEVTTQRFEDGSSRTVVLQPDGSRIVTIQSSDLRVLRRSIIGTDGREIVLFDDTQSFAAVDVSTLPEPERTALTGAQQTDMAALRAALQRANSVERSFSLAQVREIERVRYLAPAIEIDNITFATGSAAVQQSQVQSLLDLGTLMAELIEENPQEVFLIEGHTDAVGSAVSNLTLSDRRAESVALALSEFFGVPAANMVLQGYGETDLRVPTLEDERANRRVVVRRVTPLLQTAQAN
ncbi:OmpA family protein [Rhodobacteraceae bacterium M385]|nr:OmpA family protein [Rhodobacteraceae bacterium M385]